MLKLHTLLFLIALQMVGLQTVNAQVSPPDGHTEFEAYSLFRSYYSTGEYSLSANYGQWILENRPRSIERFPGFSLEREFQRFIELYSNWALSQSDPAEKRATLQKGLAVFDMVFETFSEEELDMFLWIRNKGRFYQQHSSVLPDALNQAFAYYEQAYEMNIQRFAQMDDGYYAIRLLDYHISQGNRDRAFEIIEEIEPFAGPTLQSAIEEARDQLFTDPQERIDYLQQQLSEAQSAEDREDLLSEIRSLHSQLGNSEDVLELTRQLYQLNPNFENTQRLANNAIENADYESALPLLEEALDMAPSERIRRQLILEIIDTYRYLGRFQQARDVAKNAIQAKPQWGELFLRVADIYIAVIRQCTGGSTLQFKDRSVYWLALDYLRRAAEVDTGLRNTVTQRINSLRNAVPSVSDIVNQSEFADLGVAAIGNTYRIDSSIGNCYSWINETTTIQRPPE